jgi:hypothetical protein
MEKAAVMSIDLNTKDTKGSNSNETSEMVK